MLKEERHRFILEKLQADRKIIAADLSALLDVSEDTIRRDLRELADSGSLLRVHGGALPRSPAATHYAARQTQATEAKAAIARAAAGLVSDGQVVIMGGGTTMLELAHRFRPDCKATVVTNSPPVAIALADYPDVGVILVGGRLFKESLVLTGGEALAGFQKVRADICLLGICSLHPEVGISVPDLEESHVMRAMIQSSAEVVALASAEKLDTASHYVVGPLSDLTHLVTENLQDHVLAPYRAQGISVITA